MTSYIFLLQNCTVYNDSAKWYYRVYKFNNKGNSGLDSVIGYFPPAPFALKSGRIYPHQPTSKTGIIAMDWHFFYLQYLYLYSINVFLWQCHGVDQRYDRSVDDKDWCGWWWGWIWLKIRWRGEYALAPEVALTGCELHAESGAGIAWEGGRSISGWV